MSDDLVERLRHQNGGYALPLLLDEAADEIERLQTELERTRQAWVDGDDPMCDDVCVNQCKGPCGVIGGDDEGKGRNE